MAVSRTSDQVLGASPLSHQGCCRPLCPVTVRPLSLPGSKRPPMFRVPCPGATAVSPCEETFRGKRQVSGQPVGSPCASELHPASDRDLDQDGAAEGRVVGVWAPLLSTCAGVLCSHIHMGGSKPRPAPPLPPYLPQGPPSQSLAFHQVMWKRLISCQRPIPRSPDVHPCYLGSWSSQGLSQEFRQSPRA